MDQLPRLGKRELICLLLFTCNYVIILNKKGASVAKYYRYSIALRWIKLVDHSFEIRIGNI